VCERSSTPPAFEGTGSIGITSRKIIHSPKYIIYIIRHIPSLSVQCEVGTPRRIYTDNIQVSSGGAPNGRKGLRVKLPLTLCLIRSFFSLET